MGNGHYPVWRWTGVAVIVLTGSLSAGSQAGAATAEAVKVTPNSGLKPGKLVKVAVSGFAPVEVVKVAECSGDAAISPPTAACDGVEATTITTGATGAGAAPLRLAGSDPISANPLAACPLSAADYAAGVNCGIVATNSSQSQVAGQLIYFAPPPLQATATPLHSGLSNLSLTGSRFASYGTPAGCLPSTGPPSPVRPCTAALGEMVSIRVNNILVGTVRADPANSGAISFSGQVTLVPGSNTITATGASSKEKASAVVVTTARK